MKIGTYKGIELNMDAYVPVTKEEVENELANIVARKQSYKTKEGKSALGDTVNIDYKGLLDDVAFEGGTAEKYDLELGSNSFIPGFEDQLVGYEAGSDVDVNVTFPEQYHAPNLAGKDVVFKCHIHEVKEKVTPVLNDEFAQSYGLANVSELKNQLELEMNKKKKNDWDNEYLGRLMVKIIAESEVEVSEELMKSRVDEMYDYYEQQIAQYGMDINTYLTMQNISMEDFRNQLAVQAMDSAKGDVIFEEIAKAEGITVSEDDINYELGKYREYYEMNDAAFNEFVTERKADVAKDIERRKTAVFLLNNNK